MQHVCTQHLKPSTTQYTPLSTPGLMPGSLLPWLQAVPNHMAPMIAQAYKAAHLSKTAALTAGNLT